MDEPWRPSGSTPVARAAACASIPRQPWRGSRSLEDLLGCGAPAWEPSVPRADVLISCAQVVRGHKVPGGGVTRLRRRLKGGDRPETVLRAGCSEGFTGGARRVWGGVVAVGRHGGRPLQCGALDREMLLQPRRKDLGFRVLAQAFRPVLEIGRASC